MENSSIDGGIEPTGTESKIPYILAIAAFILGGLAFIFAFNAKSARTLTIDSMKKEVAAAAEEAKQAAAIARNAGVGNEGIAEVKTDFAQFEAKVKSDYSALIQSHREVITRTNELSARLAQLEQGRRSAPAAATPAPARANNNAPAAGTPAKATGGKYTVKKATIPAKSRANSAFPRKRSLMRIPESTRTASRSVSS